MTAVFVKGILRPRQDGWTQAEVDYLARNLSLGYSYSQIAQGLGRSRSSVAGQMRRMRGKQDVKRVEPAMDRKAAAEFCRGRRMDQVAELLSEGFLFGDIAEELGITRPAVIAAFKRIRAQLGAQAR